MLFRSTRGKALPVSFREAMIQGLASDGGLYIPEQMPVVKDNELKALRQANFPELSFHLASLWLDGEIPNQTLRNIVDTAFSFEVPLENVQDQIHALELFHGPTLAFKDFGARFMALLMGHFNRDLNRELTILVATSGDTGSAVANAFYKVGGTRVILLFPKGKISQIQRKQMTTLGSNVTALAVEGTFDDCQSLVKQAFSDREVNRRLNLTSANSINIARLIPQSFYYFYAVLQIDDSPIISVPSGNFGNLTAGLFAKKMGLGVHHFIAATNRNDVFAEYMKTGMMKPRPSVPTISNAMDVGNPSNFERMLYLYPDQPSMSKDIYASSSTDEETSKCIAEVYRKTKYVLDPHGAVAYSGIGKYKDQLEKNRPYIFLETAHPAKFADSVEPEIGRKVEIPTRLAACLELPEYVTTLEPDYGQFKSFLFS